jgi:hypothetical protein
MDPLDESAQVLFYPDRLRVMRPQMRRNFCLILTITTRALRAGAASRSRWALVSDLKREGLLQPQPR